MTLVVKHTFVSQIADDPVAAGLGEVLPQSHWNASHTLTGSADISQGGTGQATASAGFDALAPTTTRGDLIARGASSNARLGLGTSGFALISNGTDPAYTGFLQAGSGATARTWNAKVADELCVFDFGATGNGSTDDTNAIQKALSEAAVIGNGVFFPAGTYVVSAALTITGSGVVRGENAGATIIKTNSATADVFVFGASFTTLRDVGIQSSVTKSAGAMINFNNQNYCEARDFAVSGTNWFVGVTLGSGAASTGAKISRARFLGGQAAVSTGILISSSTNCVDVIIRDAWITGNSSGSQLANGISITNVGDCTLDHVSTVFAGNGLEVTPTTGQTIQALFVTNSFFDSGSGDGIGLRPTGTGQIQLIKISNSWCCTNALGIVMAGAISGGGGSLDTEILNCVVSNNTSHGILLNDSSAKYTEIIGGSCSANGAAGILVNTSVTNFLIQGVKAGPAGEFGGNVNGINLVGSNDIFTIVDCAVGGNSSTNLTIASYSGTAGRISDNRSYNPVGVTAATNMGASPFTYTAGPTAETHYVKQSATNTATITKGGQQIAALVNASTYYTIELGPNESYITTWSTTTPTYTKDVH